MNFRSVSVFSCMGLLFFMTSCTPYYYAPVTPNMPLHREKNELTATVATGDMFSSCASYSFADRWAALANFGYLSTTGDVDYSTASVLYTLTSKITNFEVGGGYFKPLGDYGSLELYGLGGGGLVIIEGDEYFSYDEQTSFLKFAFQPSIGVKNEWLELGFTPKITYLYFTNYDSPYYEKFVDEETILRNLNNDGGRFVFEPAVMVRIGFEHIKLFGAVCIPYSMENDYFEQHIYPRNISLGISVNFSTKQSSR